MYVCVCMDLYNDETSGPFTGFTPEQYLDARQTIVQVRIKGTHIFVYIDLSINIYISLGG